ncbi:MAG TPA: TetR/AcrR family transcriptional regulator [Bauldia sp.]|nr:TetR/AcrR family transcriptional regulator [Bauldia sp.]
MASRPKRAKGRAPSGAPAADPRDRVIDAFMALVAGHGPHGVELADIARDAKVSLAELRALYPGKGAILADFAARIDRAVLEGGAVDDPGEATRDRLFDVMMRRFDALAPYKPAIRRIARAAKTDPGLACVLHGLARRAQRWTFAAAGVRSSGGLGLVAAEGLVLVYGETMRTWLDDDSSDLGPTMATLDRALRRGERAMGMLSGICAALPRFAGRFGRPRPAEG